MLKWQMDKITLALIEFIENWKSIGFLLQQKWQAILTFVIVPRLCLQSLIFSMLNW